MPAHDTSYHAPTRQPRLVAFRLASDALCIGGGAGVALGFWLRPLSPGGAVVLLAGIALGIAGLALAGAIGLRETRAWMLVAAPQAAAEPPAGQDVAPSITACD